MRTSEKLVRFSERCGGVRKSTPAAASNCRPSDFGFPGRSEPPSTESSWPCNLAIGRGIRPALISRSAISRAQRLRYTTFTFLVAAFPCTSATQLCHIEADRSVGRSSSWPRSFLKSIMREPREWSCHSCRSDSLAIPTSDGGNDRG